MSPAADALPIPAPSSPRQQPAPPSSFGRDLSEILFRPSRFWARPREPAVPLGSMLFPHLVVMVGIRAVAGFGGALLRGSGLGASLGQLLTSFLAWFVLVWLFAAIVGSVGAAMGARGAARDAFRYAAYGLTPLFVIGVLAVIPFPYVSPIAELLMMPYAFYVLAIGVIPALGAPPEKAPAFAGVNLGILLVLWTVMPTLAPLIVEALVR